MAEHVIANLTRYTRSGVFFARIRIGGKLIRRSLKTKVLSVAKLKLADLEKDERSRLETRQRVIEGKALFRDLAKAYVDRLDAAPDLKPRTKEYYRQRLSAMLKHWQGLESIDVRRLTDARCREWANRYCREASPTNYNNTLIVLRSILEIAVEQGLRYDNPAALTHASVRQIPLITYRGEGLLVVKVLLVPVLHLDDYPAAHWN